MQDVAMGLTFAPYLKRNDMSHEELFDTIARQKMSAYYPAGFKRQYKTLHAVILKAMDEAARRSVADYKKQQEDSEGNQPAYTTTNIKPQLKTLSWSDFDQHKPCYSPKKKYGNFSGTILDILKDERIPNEDKIWALTRRGIIDDKTLRLFAIRCARQVQRLIKDQRSINALDVAERYANGLANDAELAAACEIARAAAWEAEGAGEAAGAAVMRAAIAALATAAAPGGVGEYARMTSFATEVAERSSEMSATAKSAIATQVQIAIHLINEFYEV